MFIWAQLIGVFTLHIFFSLSLPLQMPRKSPLSWGTDMHSCRISPVSYYECARSFIRSGERHLWEWRKRKKDNLNHLDLLDRSRACNLKPQPPHFGWAEFPESTEGMIWFLPLQSPAYLLGNKALCVAASPPPQSFSSQGAGGGESAAPSEAPVLLYKFMEREGGREKDMLLGFWRNGVSIFWLWAKWEVPSISRMNHSEVISKSAANGLQNRKRKRGKNNFMAGTLARAKATSSAGWHVSPRLQLRRPQKEKRKKPNKFHLEWRSNPFNGRWLQKCFGWLDFGLTFWSRSLI